MTAASTTPAPQAARRTQISWLAAGVLTALICAAPATRADGADVPGPEEVIETISRHIAAGALERDSTSVADPQHQFELMARVTAPHTDYDHMARLVLEDGWTRATPTQQQRFVAAFRAFLLWTFAHHVADHAGARTVVLTPADSGADQIARVKSVVSPAGGRTLSLDYRLHRVDGRWKLFDVSVDGVSLITMYRFTFARQLATRGLDGLIDLLNSRNRAQRDA